jgi:hypothetical protein
MRLGLTPDLPTAHEHAPAWRGRYTKIYRNILDTSEQLMSLYLKTLLEPEGNITIVAFKTSLNKTSIKFRAQQTHRHIGLDRSRLARQFLAQQQIATPYRLSFALLSDGFPTIFG